MLTASGNLIGAAAPVGSLSASPAAVSTTVIGQPTSTAVVVPSLITSTTTAQVSPPKKSRIPPDPNRIPKYHDERLPTGKILLFLYSNAKKDSQMFYVQNIFFLE